MQNLTPDAFDDSFGLLQDAPLSENVLLNDSDGDAGDTLTVIEVGGGAAGVGTPVAGTGGGLFTITSDGSVTFEQNDTFDSLGVGETAVTTVTYTISDGNATIDPGSQTGTVSATIQGTGTTQVATFTLTTAEFTNDGTTPVDATITLGNPGQNPKINIVFVVDVSGSTDDAAPGFTDINGLPVGDRNGDGAVGTVLDAQIATLSALSQDIASLGFPASDIGISLVTFATGADFIGTFDAGSADLDAALSQLSAGGFTNYGAALSQTNAALSGSQDATRSNENIVFFLSDGSSQTPNSDILAGRDSLVADFGADIIGIGVAVTNLDDLNDVDTTDAGGDVVDPGEDGVAVAVNSADELNDALNLDPIVAADLTAFRILVNGVPVDGIDIDDLDRSGFSWTLDIDGIDPDILSELQTAASASNEIIGEATFSDGTVLQNPLTVLSPAISTDTATVTVTITGVNDDPVAVDDTGTVGEDDPVPATINVTGNDSDPDANDDLEVVGVTQPTRGTVAIAPDGEGITFDPAGAFDDLGEGETAIETVVYTVSDGNGGTDTATVTVTVEGANDDPDAVDDTAATGAVGSTTIDLTGNDSDPDAPDDLEILSVDTTGTLGTVTVNPDDDSVEYDPNGAFQSLADGETATDTFTYTVTDGNGGTDTATVTVTVTGGNESPTALDDTGTVGEDDTVPATINVTGNDSDPDTNDDLEVVGVTQPTRGTVAIAPDGEGITFDPAGAFDDLGEGETAIETVVYTVSDGNGGTDTATVTVTVEGANDDPDAVDDTGTVGEDDPGPATINVTGNDSDPDANDDLEVVGVTQPTRGTVAIAPDGEGITFDPAGAFDDLGEGETAIETVVYTVSDGNGGTDTATVTVTVEGANDDPDAVDDTAATGAVGSTTIDLTGNDSDPDAPDDLEILSVDTTGTLGAVTVNPDDDSVEYDPNGAFQSLADGETATDTFTYTVTDGNGGTDTATVTVTVTGGNESPTAADDTGTVGEDDPGPATINVTGNDSDPDANDDLEVVGVTQPTRGTADISPDGEGITFDPAGAFDDLGEGETAIETVVYTVSDGNGGTDTATVTVTVEGANDDPDAVDDTAATGAVGSTTIDLTGNDSDPDAPDDLEILSVDTTGTLGAVTVNPDDDSVEYDPNGAFQSLADGETATDTFTYTVTDGNGGTDTATVTVTVTGGNESPTALDDTGTVGEDDPGPATINVTGNDSDPDTNDDLEVVGVTQPTRGTVAIAPDGEGITFDPAGAFDDLGEGETAIETVVYTVSDGNGGTDTATVTVTVEGANDDPDAVDDTAATGAVGSTTIDLTGNDSDPDAPDDLEILSVDTTGTLGTVTVNPDDDSVEYDPNGAFQSLADGETATDTFTYTVTDGNGGTDTATVTVTVTGGNESPTALDDTGTVGEDDPGPATINVTGNDSDPDANDDLEVVGVTQPTRGTADISPDGEGITFDPAGAFDDLGEGETAIETVVYTVSDGNGGTDTATVTVTVEGANDDPDAVDDTGTVGEDDTVPATINVTGNDSDPDTNDDLEVVGVTQPTRGTVAIAPDGEGITFDPAGAFDDLGEGETAIETVVYTVSDGNGGTDTATVTVTVEGANDDPDAVDDTGTVGEDDPVPATINVTGNDSDPDTNDDLEVVGVTQPTRGTVAIAPDGEGITFDPAGAFDDLGEGETAIETVVYTVSDGNGGTDTATVTVTVEGANDDPDAVDDTGTVGEDDPVPATINVTGNDSDPDTNDDLEVVGVTQPTRGTVAIAPDGEGITFDPAGAFDDLGEGETAIETVVYTVSDGNGGTDTATVTVTVEGANDDPDAVDDTAATGAVGSTTIDLTGNDSDPDAPDDLEILSVDTTGTLGAVTVNPDDDSVEYDPNGAFQSLADGETATDTFTYTVTDGNGGTDTATVTVTVTGGNESPTAADDTGTVGEDDPGPATINVTGNDSDPDANDDLEVVGVTQPTRGTVAIAPDGEGITFDPAGAFDDLGEGETAIETVVYTVSDGNGGQDSATVTVTVEGANDDPDAVDDVLDITQDTIESFPSGFIPIEVTSNDSDVDGDDVEILSVDDSATLGTVVRNPDNDTLEYTPLTQFQTLGDGETLIDTIVYTVTDGNNGQDTATVSIVVTGINDAPDAVQDNVNVAADDTVTVELTANDTDFDGDDVEILTINATGLLGELTIDPDNDTVTYDPNGQFSNLPDGETAIDTFTYRVTDGNGGQDTATVTVTIGGVNGDPTLVDDTIDVAQDTPVTVNVLANDSDPDGDPLTVTDATLTTPNAGTVSFLPDGTVTFEPDPTFIGDAVITYTASDGLGGISTATLTVSVSQNAPPIIAEPVSFVVPENQALAADLFAFDEEGDPLTWSIVGGDDGGLFGINPSTGRLTFNTIPDFENPLDVGGDNDYFLTVQVSDGLSERQALVQVTVLDSPENANEAPVITGPEPAPGGDDAFIFIGAESQGSIARITATDPNGDALQFQLFGEDADLFDLNPVTGLLSLNQPVPGAFGSFDNDSVYELSVQVTDGNGGEDTLDLLLPIFTTA